MANKFKLEKPEAGRSLAIASHLIGCYLLSRAGLKELGILRTERTLQGDFAEWLAAEFLNIQLCSNTVEKHFDAKDAAGNKYKIKSRIVKSMSQSTSFDFRSNELGFDFLVAVFFDPKFDVLAVLRVPRDTVVAMSHQNSSTVRFRWNRPCAADSRVERVFWRGAENLES